MHGLPEFEMRNPNKAAALVVDSERLTNVARQQLQLHTLTVEGAVIWTQQKQFDIGDRPALDPRLLGRVIAVSDDGKTLVVGAKATPGGASAGELPNGMALVYEWIDGSWVEQARLQPNDLRNGLNYGLDFGASVAIDGNILVVGAPGDAPANALAVSFDPSANVTAADNSISYTGSATFADGDAVLYQKGEGNDSVGLIDGFIYFVKVLTGNTIQLHSDVDLQTVVPLVVPTTVKTTDQLKRTNYGAVYVFERSSIDSSWKQTQKLRAGSATADADRYFGASVALRGRQILVGAPGPSGAQAGEAVHFFSRQTDVGAWREGVVQSGTGDFGRSVALAGNFGVAHFSQADTGNDIAVIGAPLAGTGGEVKVYRFSFKQVDLSNVVTLNASEAQADEQFGAAVAAISQPRMVGDATVQVNRIVVGAPLWNGPAVYAGDGTHSEQGRAFVFDYENDNWVRAARLTVEGGLPAAAAASEVRTGDRFGAAVALDGQYVVVGAPGHSNGSSNATGAAYVFYEFQDGTTGSGQSSWARSTGASTESGRLESSGAQGNDNFGAAVAIAANRMMVGIPGFDETIGASRGNLGAIRTFSTDGITPTPSLEQLRAEKLNVRASVTHYDPTSRTLFVGDAVNQKVYIYINEGLYWRQLQTLSSSDSGFGSAIDADDKWLVVGAHSVNRVHIYSRSDESWILNKTLAGTAGSSFGSSVAISKSTIVVGAPNTTVKYQSKDQPESLGDHYVTLEKSGTVFVYQQNTDTSSWSTDPYRLLMPDDEQLPESWSSAVPDSYHKVTVNGKHMESVNTS